MNEEKKRKSFLRHFARKRPRTTRLPSRNTNHVHISMYEGEKGATSSYERSSPPTCSDMKQLRNLTIDLESDASFEKKESQSMSTSWTCGTCTLLNPINRQRCQACSARKPLLESSPGLTTTRPLSRSVHSVSAKAAPRQLFNLENDKAVNTQTTPETRKAPRRSRPCRLSSTSSKTKLNKRTFRHSTVRRDNTGGLHENKPDFQSAYLSYSKRDPEYKFLSERHEQEKIEGSTENMQSDVTNLTANMLTPVIAPCEDSQQMQLTLVRVIGQLDNLTKLFECQKAEIHFLRTQNEEILQKQKEIIEQNAEMRSCLTKQDAEIRAPPARLELLEPSINTDVPSTVSPEVRHATSSEDVPRSSISSVEIDTRLSGTQTDCVVNIENRNKPQTVAVSAFESSKGAIVDSKQDHDKPETFSSGFHDQQDLEIKPSPRHPSKDKPESQKLILTPLSPAVSTQTMDPTESSEINAPSTINEPNFALSGAPLTNRTNKNVVDQKTKVWLTNKNSRQFLSEMENDISKDRSSPWISTRSKLQSTAPFHKICDQKQDDFLNSCDQPKYAYKETVRCRKDRTGLPCHDCDECRKWYLTLKNTGHDFSQDPLGLSRHRSRFQPPETPVDFWEMSFTDERNARQGEDNQTKI